MLTYVTTIDPDSSSLSLSILSASFVSNPELERDDALARVLSIMKAAANAGFPTSGRSADDSEASQIHVIELENRNLFTLFEILRRYLPEGNTEDIHLELASLFDATMLQPIVPIERSAPSGDTLANIVHSASYLSILVGGEEVGYQHHDPVIVIATPFAVVLAAIVVGGAKGIEHRVMTWLIQKSVSGEPQKSRKKRARRKTRKR